ncbi:uncharacterized protein LOC117602408 isoform X2 [Osmia lignaria lignaria]|uniref:uncharacterized protein LOC117602408 isoform X2 n=1 Tax=Osmia lignaria lignaria TaxID=1437193 RepID=UPI0014789201|nr:protein vav-1-like isoform X2 [Osmia lignaria]
MINQMSEETIATAPTSAEKPSNLDTKPRKLSVKTFDFLWKRDSRRENILKKENNQKKKDLIEGKVIESKTKNAPSNKRSFNVFKGIKRHMQIKKLTIHDSKQKNDTNCDSSTLQQNKCTVSVEGSTLSDNKCEDIKKNSDILNSSESLTATDECTLSQNECTLDNLNEAVEGCSDIETKTESVHVQVVDNYQSDNNHETIPNMHYLFSNNNTLQIESVVAEEHQVENIEEISESNINNDKAKVSLTEELLKLSNYGWYWGPISGTEADAKLMSEPDGAFLVRDSSDDRYVLTLSFKSSGKLLHARMEHSGGLFSLCNQSESEGFSSVADLINYSMNFSQSAVFCYSRPKYPGHPSFPVRLTKPVSRFNQVRSLQYLCRFVIRQNTRLDNIHKLPLPKTIKGYIEEAHY